MTKRLVSMLIALTMLLMSSMTVFASEEVVEDTITPFAQHTVYLTTNAYTELETVTARLTKRITITSSALNRDALTVVVLDDTGGYILEPTFILPGASTSVFVLATQTPATVYAKSNTMNGEFTITVSDVGL